MKPVLSSSFSVQSFWSGEKTLGCTNAVPSSSCFSNLYCICDLSIDALLLRFADRHLKNIIARTKMLMAMAAVVPAMIPALASCDSPSLGLAVCVGIGVALGAIGGSPLGDEAGMATRLGGDELSNLV